VGFFAQVYKLVAQIPEGKVAAYGQLAAMLGSPGSARTVGWAMASAPEHLNLPCHRVIRQSGELAPAAVFGGYDAQRAELEAEGVLFRPDGTVDMKACLWDPCDAYIDFVE